MVQLHLFSCPNAENAALARSASHFKVIYRPQPSIRTQPSTWGAIETKNFVVDLVLPFHDVQHSCTILSHMQVANTCTEHATSARSRTVAHAAADQQAKARAFPLEAATVWLFYAGTPQLPHACDIHRTQQHTLNARQRHSNVVIHVSND